MVAKKASIIIPHYNNDERILLKVVRKAVDQDYKNKEIILIIDNPSKGPEIIPTELKKKIKVIKTKNNLGLAGSLNEGIRNSNGKIIVTLLEDCVPKNNRWLSSLIEKFDDPNVLAVASKIKNDDATFEKLDPLVKDLMQDRQKEYSPGLDEKGCAYRREVLEKNGLFDSKHFKTAGEDYDMYYKISKQGKIISGNDPGVVHIHPLDLQKVYRRSASYARGSGVLARIYGFKFIRLKGIIKLFFPIWGIGKGIKTRATFSGDKRRLIQVCIKLNWIHLVNFAGSFIRKKQ